VYLACDTTIELVEIEHAETMTIPGDMPGQPLENQEIDTGEGFDPLESDEMQQYGGTAAAIAEATLNGAELTVTAGGGNLDFLDSIKFFIVAPGLDKQLLASETDVPQGVDWIVLDVNESVDLTDYVNAGTVRPVLEISGVGPDADTALEVWFAMGLGVSVAGTCESIFGGQ
jgi:hypothetical protein